MVEDKENVGGGVGTLGVEMNAPKSSSPPPSCISGRMIIGFGGGDEFDRGPNVGSELGRGSTAKSPKSSSSSIGSRWGELLNNVVVRFGSKTSPGMIASEVEAEGPNGPNRSLEFPREEGGGNALSDVGLEVEVWKDPNSPKRSRDMFDSRRRMGLAVMRLEGGWGISLWTLPGRWDMRRDGVPDPRSGIYIQIQQKQLGLLSPSSSVFISTSLLLTPSPLFFLIKCFHPFSPLLFLVFFLLLFRLERSDEG